MATPRFVIGKPGGAGVALGGGQGPQSVAVPTSAETIRNTFTPNRGGGGGGGGSSSSNEAAEAAKKAAAEAAKKASAEAAKKAAAEAAKKAAELAATRTQQALRGQDNLQSSSNNLTQSATELSRQKLIEAEQQRIRDEKINLVIGGGQTKVQTLKDADTGADIKLTTTYSKDDATGGRRVFEKENLLTGEKSIVTYDKDKKGGRARRTGGLMIKQEISPTINTETVKKETISYNALSTGEVQAVKTSFFKKVLDLPSKAIETVTGRKPREVFRFITGSKEKDVTKPVSIKEAIVETSTVPIKAVSILATGAGAGAEATTRKIAPDGITVTLSPTEAKEVSFLEPQFGTVTSESKSGMIERNIVVPARGERKVQIFTPERVGQGVKAGSIVSATIVSPTLFAPGFIAEGTQTALDPTKTVTQRALGGVEAATGGLILGSKALSFIRTPIEIRTPVRDIMTPQAVEVQKAVMIGGKQTTASVFRISGETSPPIIVTRTTRGRQVLDFLGKQAEKVVKVGKDPMLSMRSPPKLVKVIPAKKFSITTPETVVGNKPFLVSEVRQGSKVATLSRIEGTQGKISLEEFSQLPKTEKFLLQRQAEQLVGRKVSLKDVPRILSKEKERTSALILSEKILKLKPGKQVSQLEFIAPGRRITRSVGVSEAEKVATTDSLDLIKAKTLFKDVTFPGSRASGKTPTLETTILKIKAKPDAKDAVKFVKPAPIKKTPFSKTFQDVEVVTESAAARVPLPKPTNTKMTTTVLESPAAISAKPLIVGGIGGPETVSEFAGQGQFEITTPQIISMNGMSATTQQPSVQIKQLELQVQPEISRQSQRPGQIEILKSIQPQKEIVKQKESTKQIELLKSVQLSKQLTQPKQLIKTSQLFKQGFSPTPKVPKPIIPIKLPEKTPAQRAVNELAKSVKGEFEVFAKVGKEDVLVGKSSTLEGAGKKLSSRLKKTIAASGFIKSGGRKLTAKETGLVNGDFRVSKVDVGRIVQKKEKRLGTGQETKEIQYFRSSKKGGGNLFGSSSKSNKKSSFF